MPGGPESPIHSMRPNCDPPSRRMMIWLFDAFDRSSRMKTFPREAKTTIPPDRGETAVSSRTSERLGDQAVPVEIAPCGPTSRGGRAPWKAGPC